ncbi:MAG TPA: rod shape-determining protein MreC, partial [Nitrospiria bacterium]
DESSRLLAENIRLEEAALAHKRLEEILGLKQTGRFSFIPANVIGRDPTNWYQTLQIDKGTRDGVAVDMGVTTPRGVVGRVIEAGPTSSKILLLTDRNSAVAGLVQETRDEGIVEGTEKGLARIKYLSLLATSEEGHRVITSGLAGSFPKGFLIGILGPLTKKENDLFQEARVIPATDFSRLEEVLVITGLREEASKP